MRTVKWTWTVRPEICLVPRMLIQPVLVELESWQSKATIRCRGLFSSVFFYLFSCSKWKYEQGRLSIGLVCLSSCYSLDNFAVVFPRLGLPKGFSASIAKEWIDRRRLSIRPWASFVDQRKFSKPRNFGVMCQRVVKNVEIFNSNYTFIFLGLILYCM